MLEKKWHESSFDPKLYLQLQDLTTVLTEIESITFDFTYGSFIDFSTRRLTAHTLWKSTNEMTKIAGFITDIYLRALGTLHQTNLFHLQSFIIKINQHPLTSFATQLFTLLEDIRLEKGIISLRPGTKTSFLKRKDYLHHYFTSQRKTNALRNLPLDELFCMIYLTLFADGPEPSFSRANEKQLKSLTKIKFNLFDVFSANSTKDIITLVKMILDKLSYYNNDMTMTYFTAPIIELDETLQKNTLFDELTRTDDLATDSTETIEKEQDYFDESFSTWQDEHQTEDRKETFLQMNINIGTKTNLLSGEARETESGDQAFASAEGATKQSKQTDYSSREALMQYNDRKGDKSDTIYGEDNVNAVKRFKWASNPSVDEQEQYELLYRDIQHYERRLATTIEKILEYKQSFPRTNLRAGRLSSNLLPAVFEQYPRLFYKKDEDSDLFDANFTLMVDCSASMEQKMDETKRGVILFHEVLKQLHIPHQIIGFWEEATVTKDEDYPNYFHIIHSFSDSLYENNGAKIMQLQPEEDNRDGYSIRIVTESILKQSEKHKFLLVFSDGEPAAMNYNENGIIDTYLAVSEARKKGINVIGLYLADGNNSREDRLLMENIYGPEHIIVPYVSQLTERFTPILKRLLLQTI